MHHANMTVAHSMGFGMVEVEMARGICIFRRLFTGQHWMYGLYIINLSVLLAKFLFQH